MKKKKFFLFLILFFIFLLLIFTYKHLGKKNKNLMESNSNSENVYTGNLITDVSYSSKDLKGNEYIINAITGEIDRKNSDIIFLTDVKSIIKLNNSENIYIVSNYGKYNISNNDTIFSKGVIINYLNNKITSEYLDFSIKRNTMIVSKNVIYKNLKNILRADVAEIEIDTKDTKIFMYDNQKKVNVESIK